MGTLEEKRTGKFAEGAHGSTYHEADDGIVENGVTAAPRTESGSRSNKEAGTDGTSKRKKDHLAVIDTAVELGLIFIFVFGSGRIATFRVAERDWDHLEEFGVFTSWVGSSHRFYMLE